MVTSACLEEYYDRISKLSQDFPETWHLITKAEDKCRSEMFERYRRHLTKAAADNRLPMGLDFQPNQPWIGVFTYAARNREFWDEHVIGPATMFIARGGRNMTMGKAEKVNIPSPAKDALGLEEDGPGRKKRPKKAKKEAPSHAGGGSGSASDHPQKWGKQYITTSEGHELCFRYAKGKPGDCPEPCKDGRVHSCQVCLGKRPNTQCPEKTSGKSKGKGKGKTKNKN